MESQVELKMNIGEAAKKSNLSVKTVRFYSDIGLINPKTNENSNYRIFTPQDIEKLLFVGKARKFNFSIEECRELLSLYENRTCLLYTSPSPRDQRGSRMPSSA